MRLPRFLLNLWMSEDDAWAMTIGCFDLIVPISYGTSRERLARATEAIARQAATIKSVYSQAELVFCNCEYTFPGAEDVEWKYKQAVFEEYGYRLTARCAGKMNNSVQEAQVIAKYIAKHKLSAKRILVVTGEMHSRSARWIWKRVMPHSQVTVTCVNDKLEWEPNHPVLVQRTAWKWFLANIARQILLQIFGLDRIGKLRHRANV